VLPSPSPIRAQHAIFSKDVQNTHRACGEFRGAHSSRVLVAVSRRDELFRTALKNTHRARSDFRVAPAARRHFSVARRKDGRMCCLHKTSSKITPVHLASHAAEPTCIRRLPGPPRIDRAFGERAILLMLHLACFVAFGLFELLRSVKIPLNFLMDAVKVVFAKLFLDCLVGHFLVA